MAIIPFLNNAYFSSKVGIGTDSPGAKLDVNGDVLIKSGEYISWGTVGATSIEGSTASNKLQFRTNSADRMIIDSNGKVGIGTTSPTQKLEVNGTMLLNAVPGNNGVLALGTTQTLVSGLGGTLYLITSANSRMTILSGGNVGIGTTSPQFKFCVGVPLFLPAIK